MREYRVVAVSEIDIGDRAIRPDDKELEHLVADIKANGMKTPILVDEEMKLIDGLRRIQAHGPNDLVDVVVTDDYIDTMQIMKLNRTGEFRRDWDMRRAWDFHNATTRQRVENHYEQVKKGARKRGAGLTGAMGSAKSNSISRDLIGEISGIQSAAIQAGLYVYARAYGMVGGTEPRIVDFCRELVAKMDDGYSPYAARHDLKKIQKRGEATIVTESEQRKVLRGASASAAALARVFSDFGSISNGITVEEAEGFYSTLMRTRTELFTITKKLSERIGRK